VVVRDGWRSLVVPPHPNNLPRVSSHSGSAQGRCDPEYERWGRIPKYVATRSASIVTINFKSERHDRSFFIKPSNISVVRKREWTMLRGSLTGNEICGSFFFFAQQNGSRTACWEKCRLERLMSSSASTYTSASCSHNPASDDLLFRHQAFPVRWSALDSYLGCNTLAAEVFFLQSACHPAIPDGPMPSSPTFLLLQCRDDAILRLFFRCSQVGMIDGHFQICIGQMLISRPSATRKKA